jgi:hypothetical protein
MNEVTQLSVVILSFVAGAVGAYLGAYLKQKGENLATREDVDKITRATEEIKAQISGDMWDRQRRWETKRDILFNVVKALEASSRQLSASLATYRASAGDDFSEQDRNTCRSEARRRWMSTDDDLDHQIVLARLVCDARLNHALAVIGKQMKDIFLAAIEDKETNLTVRAVHKEVLEIIKVVQRELHLD